MFGVQYKQSDEVIGQTADTSLSSRNDARERAAVDRLTHSHKL